MRPLHACTQPYLEGDIQGGCCGGPNEFDLSMHP
jgi:hypothetical protein